MTSPLRVTRTADRLAVALALLAGAASPALAVVTWDGSNGNGNWGEAANWDTNALPGPADDVRIGVFTASGRVIDMQGDRTVKSLDIGDGGAATPVATLDGALNTLTLLNTTSSDANPALVSRTTDSRRIDINPLVLLSDGDAGTDGSYTAYFKELNNSSGGTNFNTGLQGSSGDDWTVVFRRASARGTYRLYAPVSNIAELQVQAGTFLESHVAGAFGGTGTTVRFGTGGGTVVFAAGDQYTTPVEGPFILDTAGSINASVNTRLQGTVTQGGNALTLGGGVRVMRFEGSATGSGQTNVAQTTLSLSDMGNISGGALVLGHNQSNTGSVGALVLGSGDVPTAAQFAAARTWNNSGGANTWRLLSVNSDTARMGGGFAARGSDLLITPGWAGINSTTFDRNFSVGSMAQLNGDLYADKAVKISQGIDFTGTQKVVTVAGGVLQSADEWDLSQTPINELSGVLTAPANHVLAFLAPTRLGDKGAGGGAGILRVSNASNSFTPTTTLLIGGTRGSSSTFTLPSGRTVTADNRWDNGGPVVVFSDEAAFGNAGEVVVYGGGSSGTQNGAYLLFENQGAGTKAFSRDIFLRSDNTNRSLGFGSFQGNVSYSGNATLQSTANRLGLHVVAGSMALDGATITNNRTAVVEVRKYGAGTLLVNNLTNAGDNGLNWRIMNGTLGGSGTITAATGVVMESGTTLAPGNSPGTLDINGNLTLATGVTLDIELGGATPGDGSGFYDQVNVTGSAALGNATLEVSTFGGFNPSGGVYYILSRDSGGGAFAGLAEGDLVLIDGGLGTAQITYEANWTGSQAGSTITGGNDVALYNVVVIPEPASLALAAAGALLLVPRRRA